MRGSIVIVLAFACGGCAAAASPGVRPDAAAGEWRALVGCYQMGGRQFALDSIADLKLNADRPDRRLARFAPQPAIVGGYWSVAEDGAVNVVRHDGIWGRSYEFAARGDSLVGRQWMQTDVPGQQPEAEPAVAVRTEACEVG